MVENEGVWEFGHASRPLEPIYLEATLDFISQNVLRPMLDRLEGNPVTDFPPDGEWAKAYDESDGRAVMVGLIDGRISVSAWKVHQ